MGERRSIRFDQGSKRKRRPELELYWIKEKKASRREGVCATDWAISPDSEREFWNIMKLSTEGARIPKNENEILDWIQNQNFTKSQTQNRPSQIQ